MYVCTILPRPTGTPSAGRDGHYMPITHATALRVCLVFALTTTIAPEILRVSKPIIIIRALCPEQIRAKCCFGKSMKAPPCTQHLLALPLTTAAKSGERLNQTNARRVKRSIPKHEQLKSLKTSKYPEGGVIRTPYTRTLPPLPTSPAPIYSSPPLALALFFVFVAFPR